MSLGYSASAAHRDQVRISMPRPQPPQGVETPPSNNVAAWITVALLVASATAVGVWAALADAA